MTLCSKKPNDWGYENFKWMIERDYHFTLFVDDLPSAYKPTEQQSPLSGVPIGYIENGVKYLYNHLEMTI